MILFLKEGLRGGLGAAFFNLTSEAVAGQLLSALQ